MFRIVLIIGALILFPIAAYHRIRSQATGERLDRRKEGHFILFTLRPVGIAGMLGLLAFMDRSGRDDVVVSAPARVAAVDGGG